MPLINKNLITLDLRAQNKDDVLNYIATTLQDQNYTSNKDLLLEDMVYREKEASTSMGWDIAIPHAQTEAVSKTLLFFARLNHPIEWNDDSVSVIFGILVPKKDSNTKHLKVLSALARKLINENFRQKLMQVEDLDVCYQLLAEIENEIED